MNKGGKTWKFFLSFGPKFMLEMSVLFCVFLSFTRCFVFSLPQILNVASWV